MRTALILAVAVFLITLLVRLPPQLLLPLLPAGVACAEPDGTVWRGRCGQLRVGTWSVASLSWSLHPAALLRLRIAADVASQDPSVRGQAQVELARDGAMAISALAATIAIPGGSGPVPAGATGTLLLAIDSARIQGGQLVAVQGKLDLQQLRIENPPAYLGSLELKFGPPIQVGPMVGQLTDLGGPLSVVGVLQLTPSGSYDLEGSIAARPGAGADLTQMLQMLGPPDPQGRRAFSLAGAL